MTSPEATSPESPAPSGAAEQVPQQRPSRWAEWGRWVWTTLTSMRTALALLFLLALAAIPGSLIPQSDQSPLRVSTFATQHPWWNRILEPLGFYHVFTAPWFSAIYLLLFVSLIGCILPRIGVYLRAVRKPPPRLPSRFDRLPEWARLRSAADEDALVDAAEGALKQARFRTLRSQSGDWQGVSAERGYLREFGNLLFHIALVVLLMAIAVNSLFSFKGTVVVVEGQSFSNTLTQYDEYQAGAAVNPTSLTPFTVRLDKFSVAFETGTVQRGAARMFDAAVTVTADGSTTSQHLQVNHPVDINGTRVHLVGHGYAAYVTVRDGSGHISYSGPVPFLPVDSNLTSRGVIKVPDARPQRLAFQGFFLPTAAVDQRGPHSSFPDAFLPRLFLNAWSGPPQVETGVPENVFSLNTTGMSQVMIDGKPAVMALNPGQTADLPNELGSITFVGWSRWVKLQVSRSPGLAVVWVTVLVSVFGLCLSLFVRPRRIWVRVRPDGNKHVVEVGGLDRAQASTGLDEQIAQIVGILRKAGGSSGPPRQASTTSSRGTGQPPVKKRKSPRSQASSSKAQEDA